MSKLRYLTEAIALYKITGNESDKEQILLGGITIVETIVTQQDSVTLENSRKTVIGIQ